MMRKNNPRKRRAARGRTGPPSRRKTLSRLAGLARRRAPQARKGPVRDRDMPRDHEGGGAAARRGSVGAKHRREQRRR